MVKFSKNWNNKLDSPVFTTIRYWTHEKEQYYRGQLTHSIPIYLKGEKHCYVFMWQVKRIKLQSIPWFIKVADTGLTPPDFDKLMETMYKNKPEWKGGGTLMLLLTLVHDYKGDDDL